jgi:Glycosyl hydrolase family 79 C-terminal beta domain
VLSRFAESGALGVDFHTSQDYPAFRYTNGALAVLPLYYGMLMFSLGTAEKGQLIPVSVQTTGRVRAFATLGSDGAVRVVAINEDGSATGKLTVTLTNAHGVARLSRLTAPMLSAKTGLSFEGQTFDGSTDGKPVGTRTRNTVTPSGTSYAFGLPPQSAATLVIPAL